MEELKGYNHVNSLDSYKKEIDIIRKGGFNLIGVSQIMLEDTFIFETDEEATKAFNTFENCDNRQITGWWYGKKEFYKEVKEYESKPLNNKVLVYWL